MPNLNEAHLYLFLDLFWRPPKARNQSVYRVIPGMRLYDFCFTMIHYIDALIVRLAPTDSCAK